MNNLKLHKSKWYSSQDSEVYMCQ